jgi:hypothetical protein
VYVIDPNMPSVKPKPNLQLIQEKGTIGLPKLVNQLLGAL